MCLITKDKTLRTAKEDMTVYKILKDRVPPFHGDIGSYVYGQRYDTEMGLTRETTYFDTTTKDWLIKDGFDPFSGNLDVELMAVSEGFHSAESIERLQESDGVWKGWKQIYRCVIPKGAKYYTDNHGLIVSNSIIVYEEVNVEEKVEENVGV